MKKYDFLKYIIIDGFEGENVRIINAKTKEGQDIKNKKVLGSLWDCYKTNSGAKDSVYVRYDRYCNNLDGWDYGITSYNTFQFTIGFKFEIVFNNVLYKCYAYITPSYNNIAIEEDEGEE